MLFVPYRDGSTVDAVMEQMCATLNQAPAASASPSSPPTSGSGAVRASPSANEALLLALRGVSLAGESIRAEDASSFRKVREVFQGSGWLDVALLCVYRNGGHDAVGYLLFFVF